MLPDLAQAAADAEQAAGRVRGLELAARNAMANAAAARAAIMDTTETGERKRDGDFGVIIKETQRR